MSLKTKIIAVFLISTLVPLGAIGALVAIDFGLRFADVAAPLVYLFALLVIFIVVIGSFLSQIIIRDQQKHAVLEAMILQRTRALQENKKLEKSKDDFFAIASHELRTPLSIIAGNIDNFLHYNKNPLDPKLAQLLKDTGQASDRLIALVEDFLNVSRLDQGRLAVNMAPVDACQIVAEVAKQMETSAKNKGLELTYLCSAKRGKVMADTEKLRQVIINLISNSIKFTAKGTITVSQAQQNGFLVTTVEDTGMGIPKHQQELLFRRFQQAMSPTLEREVGGTGLGLYISREFVRKMGGDLALVRSVQGKGSAFAFRLPLVK